MLTCRQGALRHRRVQMRGQANVDDLDLRIVQSVINLRQCQKAITGLADLLYPRKVLIHNCSDSESVFQSPKRGQMFTANAGA
jgi:hypothetical protein